MLGAVIFGEKYYGWPVRDGMRREIYCTKCERITLFVEMKGRKYSHVYFIPIIPQTKKIKWLECSYCSTVVVDYEDQIKKEEERLEKKKRWEKAFDEAVAESERIQVRCPSCKKEGWARLPTDQYLTEAICQVCGNIYDVRKPNP